jgi:hypothetical protein
MAETIVTAEIAPASAARFSYVDWPAIVAGAVVGSAVAFVLTAFSTALGLSIVSPYRGEGMPGVGIVIAAGLWLLWVAGMSYFAAGYVTGRLRQRLIGTAEHEVRIRDGAHGIIAWGLATLIGAALLVFGVYGAGNIASRAATAAEAAPAAAAAMRDTNNSRDTTGDTAGRYALPVARMFGAGEEIAKPGAEAARRTAAQILTAGVAAGRMSDADRDYLARLVATRSGIDEAAARTRVEQAFKDSQALATKAREAANAARKLGIVSAFALAASLLLGLVAAWWAADRGGRHRDQNTVFGYLQFR